jgi:hypothetical protein
MWLNLLFALAAALMFSACGGGSVWNYRIGGSISGR